ncbi:MAG: hypothetical protein WCG83_07315, partial [Candidatus Peregrinibacteria bacterium]
FLFDKMIRFAQRKSQTHTQKSLSHTNRQTHTNRGGPNPPPPRQINLTWHVRSSLRPAMGRSRREDDDRSVHRELP